MAALNELPPAALRAAMRGGTEGWGTWGSAALHVRYAQALSGPMRNRRMCRCGCGRKRTHMGMANGIALMGGCELVVARWVATGR
jgi:hypothetical protein